MPLIVLSFAFKGVRGALVLALSFPLIALLFVARATVCMDEMNLIMPVGIDP